MCFYITGFLLLVATDVQNSRSSFQFPCRVVYQVKTSWRGWFSRNAPFERSWGKLIDEIYNDVVIHVCMYGSSLTLTDKDKHVTERSRLARFLWYVLDNHLESRDTAVQRFAKWHVCLIWQRVHWKILWKHLSHSATTITERMPVVSPTSGNL